MYYTWRFDGREAGTTGAVTVCLCLSVSVPDFRDVGPVNPWDQWLTQVDMKQLCLCVLIAADPCTTLWGSKEKWQGRRRSKLEEPRGWDSWGGDVPLPTNYGVWEALQLAPPVSFRATPRPPGNLGHLHRLTVAKPLLLSILLILNFSQ